VPVVPRVAGITGNPGLRLGLIPRSELLDEPR
jgi:hypothetical protein